MSDTKDVVLESLEQTKATYKQLGKSGLRVSVPILGAMSFGDAAWQPWVLDEEKVIYYTGASPKPLTDLYCAVSATIKGSL